MMQIYVVLCAGYPEADSVLPVLTQNAGNQIKPENLSTKKTPNIITRGIINAIPL
jgi:hypothetical protein